MDNFYEVIKKEDTKTTIRIKLPVDVVNKSYNELLKSRGESLNIKGFRKGKIPPNFIEPQFEQLLMTETFERLAPYYVNAAIIKEELEPIAPPEYTELETLNKGEQIVFQIVILEMPKFKLGKLSGIKVDKSEPEVKDEEIQQTLESMYNNNIAIKKQDKDEKAGIDDDWAKEIAKLYQFRDVNSLEDLKANLRDLLIGQKKQLINQNRTTEIIKQAVKLSGIEVPDEAVQYEAIQREEAFQKDLESIKMKMDDFLKERNLKLEDLKDKWKADAKEALENDILLKLYAEANDVQVSDEELEQEVESIKKSAEAHYMMEHKDHDHEIDFDESAYDNPQWQAQIRVYLQKQKAYKMLVTEVLGEDIFQGPNAEEVDESDGIKRDSKTQRSEEKDSENNSDKAE